MTRLTRCELGCILWHENHSVDAVRPVRPWHKDPKQSTRMEERRVLDDQSYQYSAISHPGEQDQSYIWTDEASLRQGTSKQKWESLAFDRNATATRKHWKTKRNQHIVQRIVQHIPQLLSSAQLCSALLGSARLCSALLSASLCCPGPLRLLMVSSEWWLSGHAAQRKFQQFEFCLEPGNLIENHQVEPGWTWLNLVEPGWTILHHFDTAPGFVIESSQVLVKALPSSNALAQSRQWNESDLHRVQNLPFHLIQRDKYHFHPITEKSDHSESSHIFTIHSHSFGPPGFLRFRGLIMVHSF